MAASSLISKHPVGSFVVLTYLITWPFQVAALFRAESRGIELSNEDNYRHFTDLMTGDAAAEVLGIFLLFNLGQFGPLLAALAVTLVLYGRPGLGDLGRRMRRWRLPARWYLTVLAIPILLSALSLGMVFVAGGFSAGPFEPGVRWALFVPFLLYMVVFTGLAEEPGWRGFALPHLQAGHTASRASWILGFIWGIWHVPFTLYFNRDDPALIVPSLLGLTFGIVGWTMVNTWIYNSTGSVLLMILLHGWNNAVQSYLVLSQPSFVAQTLYAVLPWGLAILLSKRYGDENLSERPRAVWWPGRYEAEQPVT